MGIHNLNIIILESVKAVQIQAGIKKFKKMKYILDDMMKCTIFGGILHAENFGILQVIRRDTYGKTFC